MSNFFIPENKQYNFISIKNLENKKPSDLKKVFQEYSITQDGLGTVSIKKNLNPIRKSIYTNLFFQKFSNEQKLWCQEIQKGLLSENSKIKDTALDLGIKYFEFYHPKLFTGHNTLFPAQHPHIQKLSPQEAGLLLALSSHLDSTTDSSAHKVVHTKEFLILSPTHAYVLDPQHVFQMTKNLIKDQTIKVPVDPRFVPLLVASHVHDPYDPDVSRLVQTKDFLDTFATINQYGTPDGTPGKEKPIEDHSDQEILFLSKTFFMNGIEATHAVKTMVINNLENLAPRAKNLVETSKYFNEFHYKYDGNLSSKNLEDAKTHFSKDADRQALYVNDNKITDTDIKKVAQEVKNIIPSSELLPGIDKAIEDTLPFLLHQGIFPVLFGCHIPQPPLTMHLDNKEFRIHYQENQLILNISGQGTISNLASPTEKDDITCQATLKFNIKEFTKNDTTSTCQAQITITSTPTSDKQ